jgi:thiol:disulfide interchange protein DsbC
MLRHWIATLAFLAVPAFAAPGDVVPEPVLAKLRANLEAPGGLRVESARESEMPGIIEVQFADGPVVYASEDGSFFVIGDLYAAGPAGYVNLAEKRRDGERREAIAALSTDEMIVFPAEGKTRGRLTVFTDTTCFYCQKLHQEVPELNRRGVEVRYLAYPRAGVGSDGFRQLATAWCAVDQRGTLTRLKQGESVKDNVCTGNPVAEHYNLGQDMGVRGTPAIVMESGEMIPGYRPAEDLLSAMGLESP